MFGKIIKLFRLLRSPEFDAAPVQGAPGEDQTFIRLVQLIEEDPEFNRLLLKIINMDSFNRCSMLNSIIHQQGLKGANAEHLQALKYLTDDRVCEKIKALVKQGA